MTRRSFFTKLCAVATAPFAVKAVPSDWVIHFDGLHSPTPKWKWDEWPVMSDELMRRYIADLQGYIPDWHRMRRYDCKLSDEAFAPNAATQCSPAEARTKAEPL